MGLIQNSKVDKWLTKEKLELISCWARDFSQKEIADKMGIAHKTLIEWRKIYPEFDNALAEGQEIVDYRVENALLKIALGYQTTEIKTFLTAPNEQTGNCEIKRIEKIQKDVAPNSTAILAWLNNRKPKDWKRNRDLLTLAEENDKNIKISIVSKDKENKNIKTKKEIELETKSWQELINNKKEKENKKIQNKKVNSKTKTKIEQEQEKDLDYWPDDWEE